MAANPYSRGIQRWFSWKSPHSMQLIWAIYITVFGSVWVQCLPNTAAQAGRSVQTPPSEPKYQWHQSYSNACCSCDRKLAYCTTEAISQVKELKWGCSLIDRDSFCISLYSWGISPPYLRWVSLTMTSLVCPNMLTGHWLRLTLWPHIGIGNTVSTLWRDEGYTIKYSLRELRRAINYIWPHIPSRVIITTVQNCQCICP